MNSIQAVCIISAGVLTIASIWWKPIPWQVPVALLTLAFALDKFSAK